MALPLVRLDPQPARAVWLLASVVAFIAGIAALEDIAHTDASRTNNDIWLPWLATELTKLGLKPLPSVGNFVSVGFGSRERAAAANDWLMKDGLIPRMIAGYGMPEFLRITVGTEKEVKLEKYKDWPGYEPSALAACRPPMGNRPAGHLVACPPGHVARCLCAVRAGQSGPGLDHRPGSR